MSSVNEILNDLNSLKSDIQVYIPSSKSNKKTKTLNLKQQKELLDNLSESNLRSLFPEGMVIKESDPSKSSVVE